MVPDGCTSAHENLSHASKHERKATGHFLEGDMHRHCPTANGAFGYKRLAVGEKAGKRPVGRVLKC
jgi:hypothetical protein